MIAALWLACASPQPCGGPSAAAPGSWKALFAGDTLLGDAAQDSLDEHGYTWPFAELRPWLADADYRVVNLEGPITERTEPYEPHRPWSYNAGLQAAAALAEVGIDAAGLANNHAMDRGPEGLADTLAALEAAGISAFGAGADKNAAIRPLVVDTGDGRVGLVALARRTSLAQLARKDHAGFVPITEANAIAAVQAARQAGADHVVAFVHWGRNYEPVDEEQRVQAGWLVSAGADLVVGHGSHSLQPIEFRCGVPIVWSLGNFVFGTPGRFDTDAPGYGLLLGTTWSAAGPGPLELRCVRTDNDVVHHQPRPCTLGEAQQVLGALHPEVVVDGDVGQVSW